MTIRPIINVRDDKLSRGFLSAVKFCHEISVSEDQDISLSGISFVMPSFLLPALVFLESIEPKPIFSATNSYLSTVHFTDGGINASIMRASEFKILMAKFSGNSYIPVIKFPTDIAGTDKRDAILSAIQSILSAQGCFGDNVENGLRYIIGETIDNIVEHAHSPYGYITAQSYPTKGYTDICIADTGGTLWGSYSENPRTAGIGSDIEALQSAVSGISAKNLPETENRGYGLRTTIKMLTKGLSGEYLLASGDAAFAANKAMSQYIELPLGIKFKGTIVSFRIPNNMPTFSYLKYVE